jgi:hypothetical protein
LPFFDRFTRRWASAGVVAEPTTTQSDTGFAYLGQSPPTVEGFNSLFQMLDDKDGWLYRQIRGVLTRAGMAPVQVGDDQLADALRALGSRPPAVFTATGAHDYVVPANVARVFAIATGAGGGSCHSIAGAQSGAGGGGGGSAIGWYSVTPGARVPVVVGAGGPFGGAVAGAGGTSSFGTFCSAAGGQGGASATGFVAGGNGGNAAGGLINLRGGDGGDGHPTLGIATGYGAGSIWGAGPRAGIPLPASYKGNDGTAPGTGAAGPYDAPARGLGAPGGTGAAGIVLVVPIA